MDRNAFAILCDLLKTRGGLLDDGALDGTYIEVTVPESEKPRYRTRKGHIATNVLGACTRDLKFVDVLSGWEGSAIDSRVLRDVITRHNGLKVPFVVVFGKDQATCSMAESTSDALDHMGLENDELDTSGFT
ncbi:hypothetical protein Dsin_024252 [Dipteronia sinensis]|uniref:DDE Tnp4 domain-containing protein n=1 Tax=Dipteronia sinensis TaxID=43782 RepID=A0AAD9ZU36_9ROSI|nr:hypothetical protein Dsin_024252 [Dipteronia sinensis]